MTPVTLTDAGLLTSPRCPLCHTLDLTMTSDALIAGAAWQCTRCGHGWSAVRLATAAAYARFARDYASHG